jgi:hypothetical protein
MTTALKHQAAELAVSADLPGRGFLWEMGVGKSFQVIANAVHLRRAGKIDCCLVIAPNGVDENWTTEQFPAHVPDDCKGTVLLYRPEKRETKWHERELKAGLFAEGMLWVAFPYDVFKSEAGKKWLKLFLMQRKCLYVLDESSAIKTPGIKTTMSCMASAKYAPYKRICEGTPVSNAPFDVYTQLKFLDSEFWVRELGITTFAEFKSYFGEFRPGFQRYTCPKTGKEKTREFPQLVAYKRLDVLRATVLKMCSRLLKRDVLDLPPKVYSTRPFALTAAQRKVYDAIQDDFIAVLDSGDIVTAPLAITQMLRKQQIACGYVPVDSFDGNPQPVQLIGTTNPRLDACVEMTERVTHAGIIWARFHKDVELIKDALGAKAVIYDGTISADERQRNKEAFLAGDAQWFVANPAAAARGHTLLRAKTSLYYSNSFSYIQRAQSEDRNHRVGQTESVHYVDLIAQNTIDSYIVRALRKKQALAAEVTGDAPSTPEPAQRDLIDSAQTDAVVDSSMSELAAAYEAFV